MSLAPVRHGHFWHLTSDANCSGITVIAASVLSNENRELASQVQAVKNAIEKLII
jgi:hypothetical protein